MSHWLIILFSLAAAVLCYAQIGYPLLMLCFSRNRSQDKSPSNELPSVSLIIPAYNEEVVLQAKLENALSLDYPEELLEILVASDGSSDRTVEIAEAYSERGVKVLAFEQRRGKASVVNDAAGKATGEVLCFCDANVMFRPDALLQLVTRLEDPNIGGATGQVRLASHESQFEQGESLYYRIDRAIQQGESWIGSSMGVDGGMYVLRRELFQPLKPDTILDDFVIAMSVLQQGKRVVYEPKAIADENGTPTARQEFRRRVRISAGSIQALLRRCWPPLSRPIELWQFLSHKLARWIGPILLLVILSTNAFLWQESTFFKTALVMQLAFYLLAVLGAVCVPFRKLKLIGVPFYFTMSHVAMAVGMLKGMFNLQRVTWQKAERTNEHSELQAVRPGQPR